MPEAPAGPLRIVHLARGEDATAWDRYLSGHTGAVTDLSAWRTVVNQAYGIHAHFLAAYQGETLVGALGLYEIRHHVFGHYLTTAAFGTDGGFRFDNLNIRDALVAEATRLVERVKAGYLVIRTREAVLEGFQVDDQYRTAVLDLAGGSETVWKALPGKTRNQVRRGQKEGFIVQTGPEQLDAFFDVFHQHMRHLGSPAHHLRFYQAIVREFGPRAEFIVVRDGNALVGGALLFHTGATAMNLHTVTLREYNRRCPNYLLYWSMIESACRAGCRDFDMGRSRADSGNLQFKDNWNPQEVQLHYNYRLNTAKAVPNLDPRNPRYRLQIALWQRLPLPVTRALGPKLISGLG